MKIRRLIWSIAACVALTCGMASCVNQSYMIMDDDEWSGAAIDNDRSLINGELEMDDWDC